MAKSRRKPNHLKRWSLIVLGIILLGLLISGIRWATFARPPLPESLAALESDEIVLVSAEPWLNFNPVETEPTTGLIFYPGGRIDPRGYAPLLREISAAGYLVVVPSMPINMAVFNPNAADEIRAHFSAIEYWVMAGHSVGGTMAAQYTSRNLDLVDGLVIWASYPAANADLSRSGIPVYSIFGEMDLAASPENVFERKDLLPSETRYIMIGGGDHHQFGSYEIKLEEIRAIIPRSVQQPQIIQATLELLDQVSLKNQ